MKRLLWIGDAGCPSGFARATHGILDVVRQHFDVTVLGINYQGDPHQYPYPIYVAAAGGTWDGLGRLIWMCDTVKPDVIVIQQDPWNIPPYIQRLKSFFEYADIPVIASLAVDGKNVQGAWLGGLSLAVFWTQFGLTEARAGGYTGPAAVVPLGVDLSTYYPTNKLEARRRRLPKDLDDAFIIGNVNRNQPRKRWDLTVKYFAEWIKQKNIDDAYLYLHRAPTGDSGPQVEQLAQYYGVLPKLIFMQPAIHYGIPEDQMRDTYNSFDLQVSTTQGEGFGLTTFEGMACGVPQIVPDWAALGELCKDAALLVSCSSTATGFPYVNIIGGVPDEEEFIQALDDVYRDDSLRTMMRERGLSRVQEDRFRWQNIGQAFNDVIEFTVAEGNVAV